MTLRVEQDGSVRRITLAAPEKRNLLDGAACEELLKELRDAAADSNTNAILIDADGQIFCSGVHPCDSATELFSIGYRISKPIVIAVQGVAVAGAIGLLATAHVVVAAQGTSFGLTDIREGKWNEDLMRSISKAIGERRALELGLTGRIFSTQDALHWGLVHEVAPAFELDDRATAIANALSKASPDVVQTALRSRC